MPLPIHLHGVVELDQLAAEKLAAQERLPQALESIQTGVKEVMDGIG